MVRVNHKNDESYNRGGGSGQTDWVNHNACNLSHRQTSSPLPEKQGRLISLRPVPHRIGNVVQCRAMASRGRKGTTQKTNQRSTSRLGRLCPHGAESGCWERTQVSSGWHLCKLQRLRHNHTRRGRSGERTVNKSRPSTWQRCNEYLSASSIDKTPALTETT